MGCGVEVGEIVPFDVVSLETLNECERGFSLRTLYTSIVVAQLLLR